MAVLEDFEDGALGWSDNKTTTGSAAFTRFLGRFAQQQETSKTYIVDEAAQEVVITFDVYEIDSWDGEAFRVSVNGEEVFAKPLRNSFTDSSESGIRNAVQWRILPTTDGTADLGFGNGARFDGQWYTDQKFFVELRIANPGDRITIGFSSDLDGRAADDEAFGIDNLHSNQLYDPAAPTSDTALTIQRPWKIGVGTWEIGRFGGALNDVEEAGLGWYYNWRTSPLNDASPSTAPALGFVPMVWSDEFVTVERLDDIVASGAYALLTFNEPDLASQANMSVKEALDLWPQLMATGLRLSSPAPTNQNALGDNSWLGQFMSGVEERGYSVDFIAVHYYSENADIGAFRSFLEAIYEAYDRPVWVTEWALVDWDNPDRFSQETISTFARDAILMMDDLDYVERNAWFGAYEGGDGWYLNTALFDSGGRPTQIGDLFGDLANPDSVAKAFVDRVYNAAYGREPDDAGLDFWSDVLIDREPGKLEEADRAFLASFFLSAAEFVERYGSDPSDAEYVDAMYRNVLDRNADAAGLSFWIGQMERGLGYEDILVYFADSQENVEQATLTDASDAWIFGG